MSITTPYPASTNGNNVTFWIPLTTAWSYAKSCSNSFIWEGDRLVAYDPGYGISIDTAVRCQPPAVTSWWNQAQLGGGYSSGFTAISIGPLVCPEGFSTVATFISDQSSTQAMCCPPGYNVINGAPGPVVGDCISTITPGQTLTYAFALSTNTDSYTVTTTSISETSTVGAIAVIGWNINVVNQGSTAISGSTSMPNSASDTTSVSPTSSSVSSHRLTSGAKAGIGIGVGLSVIGLLALLTAVLLYRSRRIKEQRKPIENKQIQYPNPHERLMWQYNAELDAMQVRERSNCQPLWNPPPVELDAHRI